MLTVLYRMFLLKRLSNFLWHCACRELWNGRCLTVETSSFVSCILAALLSTMLACCVRTGTLWNVTLPMVSYVSLSAQLRWLGVSTCQHMLLSSRYSTMAGYWLSLGLLVSRPLHSFFLILFNPVFFLIRKPGLIYTECFVALRCTWSVVIFATF